MSSLGYFIPDKLVKLFTKFNDDDKIDKLCRKYSAIMLLFLALFLSPFQLTYSVMTCWCMKEYGDCKTVTRYCYITEKYIPVSNTTHLPSRKDIINHKISYYEWMPYIFIFLTLLSYTPSILWHWFVRHFGYNVNVYVEKIKEDTSLVSDDVSKYIAKDVYRCLERRGYLSIQRYYSEKGRLSKIVSEASLFFSYIFVKCLYAFSILFQIYFINYVFQDDYYKQSSSTLTSMDHKVTNLDRFPRMVFCKFELQTLYNYQKHWVQCILPDNIYLEKTFLILRIWLYILFVLVVLSLLRYVKYVFPRVRRAYIESRLKDEGLDNFEIEKLNDNMSLDSVLALKLTNSNSYDFQVTSILKSLYELIEKKN